MARQEILDRIQKYVHPFRVTKGKGFQLKDFDPSDTRGLKLDKGEAAGLLQASLPLPRGGARIFAVRQRLSLGLRGKLRARGRQLPLLLLVDLRVCEVELLDHLDDRRGDGKAGEPLVVGRHHVPGRVLGRRGPNHLLERMHVVVPELALTHVGRGKFPILLGPLKTLHEALLLFLARHVQEELEDDRPLSGEVVLEMRDVGEALIPDALANERRGKLLPLQDLLMHAHDENLFVVRPVEDADPSPFGKTPGIAPHEVVIEVFRRGLLERDDLADLRIDA